MTNDCLSHCIVITEYEPIHFTALQGNLKWQKNIRWISRVPWERPHLELQKEPLLDGLEKPLPNPLMASLLQRLAIKGFWVWLLQPIKWGLISKLSMRTFSWHPQNPSDIFCHFKLPWSTVKYILTLNRTSVHIAFPWVRMTSLLFFPFPSQQSNSTQRDPDSKTLKKSDNQKSMDHEWPQ